MSQPPRTRRAAGRLPRCLLTWLTVTALTGLLGDVCVSLLTVPVPPAVTAEEMLVRGAALVALLCLPPAWWTSTSTCWQVARGTWTGAPTGVVRRAVLVACGGAIALGGLSPAHAGGQEGGDARSQRVLHGLPLPDRPSVDEESRHSGRPSPVDRRRTLSRLPGTTEGPAVSAHREHRVLGGESLWSIAEAQLPPTADDAAVAALWRRIHAANAQVVGDDPDLIHPGQRLRLPDLRATGAAGTSSPHGHSGPADHHEGDH